MIRHFFAAAPARSLRNSFVAPSLLGSTRTLIIGYDDFEEDDLDEACARMSKARADPYSRYRKERLPMSEVRKLQASNKRAKDASQKVSAVANYLKFKMDKKYN